MPESVPASLICRRWDPVFARPPRNSGADELLTLKLLPRRLLLSTCHSRPLNLVVKNTHLGLFVSICSTFAPEGVPSTFTRRSASWQEALIAKTYSSIMDPSQTPQTVAQAVQAATQQAQQAVSHASPPVQLPQALATSTIDNLTCQWQGCGERTDTAETLYVRTCKQRSDVRAPSSPSRAVHMHRKATHPADHVRHRTTSASAMSGARARTTSTSPVSGAHAAQPR